LCGAPRPPQGPSARHAHLKTRAERLASGHAATPAKHGSPIFPCRRRGVQPETARPHVPTTPPLSSERSWQEASLPPVRMAAVRGFASEWRRSRERSGFLSPRMIPRGGGQARIACPSRRARPSARGRFSRGRRRLTGLGNVPSVPVSQTTRGSDRRPEPAGSRSQHEYQPNRPDHQRIGHAQAQ